MEDEAIKFGKNLKRIRTEKAMSQGDIARTLNVSRGYISNIENGKQNLTITTIGKLAKALGVSSSEFLK
tara:strand:- start:1809 stop:2015 length:207 start_codon:yes stop_codon:yes gene_type:complete